MIAIGIGVAMAALAQLPLAQVQGAPPIYREIKDWVLACDNTRACVAKYVAPDEGSGGGGYLSVERAGGPNGKLAMTLEIVDGQGSPDPAKLLLDGRTLGAYPWTVDAGDQAARLEGAAALGFVRAIKDGAALTYSGAKDAPSVPLSGMKAALLAMDEDQGRLDGQTALVRPGPKPASMVPAAPPVPVVHASPTPDNLPNAAAFAATVRRTQARVLARHECDPEAVSADEAHALDAREALVLLGCVQGAYQGSVIAFRAPRAAPGQARQLILPLQPTVDPKSIPAGSAGEYVAEGWDARTASFTESAKGRGPADCGSSSTWTFDGKAFQLTQYNALNRCGGGPPGDWPTLYRARVVTDR